MPGYWQGHWRKVYVSSSLCVCTGWGGAAAWTALRSLHGTGSGRWRFSFVLGLFECHAPSSWWLHDASLAFEWANSWGWVVQEDLYRYLSCPLPLPSPCPFCMCVHGSQVLQWWKIRAKWSKHGQHGSATKRQERCKTVPLLALL